MILFLIWLLTASSQTSTGFIVSSAPPSAMPEAVKMVAATRPLIIRMGNDRMVLHPDQIYDLTVTNTGLIVQTSIRFSQNFSAMETRLAGQEIEMLLCDIPMPSQAFENTGPGPMFTITYDSLYFSHLTKAILLGERPCTELEP